MEEALKTLGPARKWIVMVVEDETSIRSMVCEHLRELGFTIIEAVDAHEAIAIFASSTPIDLVFTDVDMPGTMDGLMLASWVREHHPNVRIIVTSGVAALIGGSHILQKPYSPGSLVRKIRELLGEAGASAALG